MSLRVFLSSRNFATSTARTARTARSSTTRWSEKWDKATTDEYALLAHRHAMCDPTGEYQSSRPSKKTPDPTEGWDHLSKMSHQMIYGSAGAP